MKVSASNKVALACAALVFYFALAIFGFEKAKADTLDDMVVHAECIANLQMAGYVMEESGQPDIAKVFYEMKGVWWDAWEWDAELRDKFVQIAWDFVREDAGINGGEEATRRMFTTAKKCAIAMELYNE